MQPRPNHFERVQQMRRARLLKEREVPHKIEFQMELLRRLRTMVRDEDRPDKQICRPENKPEFADWLAESGVGDRPWRWTMRDALPGDPIDPTWESSESRWDRSGAVFVPKVPGIAFADENDALHFKLRFIGT